MSTFRLAKSPNTGGLQLQICHGERWVHYCYVVDAAQALSIVGETDPDLLEIARADLMTPVLDGKSDPSVVAPIDRDAVRELRSARRK